VAAPDFSGFAARLETSGVPIQCGAKEIREATCRLLVDERPASEPPIVDVENGGDTRGPAMIETHGGAPMKPRDLLRPCRHVLLRQGACPGHGVEQGFRPNRRISTTVSTSWPAPSNLRLPSASRVIARTAR
jgi:hypothetical protein